MKTGIVIPFYNGHQFINRLVESFDHAARGLECTLFIIDNSPGDQPIVLSRQPEMKMEIIKEKTGIGYGKACNKGYQLCKDRNYDYIIIANQDGYVSGNFIREILDPFQRDNKVLISAPILRVYEGQAIEDFFILYYVSQVPQLFADLVARRCRPYYEMNQVSGACFAFSLKNKLYRYPHLFDPIFHMYAEDDDLCFRVKRLDGKIVLVCPETSFYHRHSYTSEQEDRRKIEVPKQVSEKILRLKDVSKSSIRILYGIFVTTASGFTYHFLRGELKLAYYQILSSAIILFRLPDILKSRKRDSITGKTAGMRMDPYLLHFENETGNTPNR